jgi:hypothetical protein
MLLERHVGSYLCTGPLPTGAPATRAAATGAAAATGPPPVGWHRPPGPDAGAGDSADRPFVALPDGAGNSPFTTLRTPDSGRGSVRNSTDWGTLSAAVDEVLLALAPQDLA